MAETPPVASPEPYREPRTGFAAVWRKRGVRRAVIGAAVLGLVALVDQSFVRTESAPFCLVCASSFDEVVWTIDVPGGLYAEHLSTLTTPRGISAAAEWVGAGHAHALLSSGDDSTRGVVAPRSSGGNVCCSPAFFPGRFTQVLNAEPEFASFVRHAVSRGEATREDVTAAIEIVTDFDDTETSAEERRVRDVANALYAAWRGKPVTETDLWHGDE